MLKKIKNKSGDLADSVKHKFSDLIDGMKNIYSDAKDEAEELSDKSIAKLAAAKNEAKSALSWFR